MAANSIKIDVGVKRILINDGPEYIQFNPSDVVFVEKFQTVIAAFEAKIEEYKAHAKEIDDNVATDKNGLPANLGEKLAMLRELCEFAHSQIDILFGDGTSQKLFNGALSMDMIEQFFDGIVPFIQDARDEKASRYTKRAGKVLK